MLSSLFNKQQKTASTETARSSSANKLSNDKAINCICIAFLSSLICLLPAHAEQALPSANEADAKSSASSPAQSDASEPLRGPIPAKDRVYTPEPLGGSPVPPDTLPKQLLPADTVPLPVDQFTNKLKPIDLRGPVGNLVQIVSEISANKPCRNCSGIKIRVQNLSSTPIIVDGEHAQAIGASGNLGAISENSLLKSSGGTFTKKQKEVLAAVALGSLGLAEPIVQDHFSTSKTDFPVSYGVNETRRRLEDRRFCKRIILPGEDTEGVIYFPGDSLSFNKISIPLLTYPQEQASGMLDILGGPETLPHSAATDTSKVPATKVKAEKTKSTKSAPPAVPAGDAAKVNSAKQTKKQKREGY